MPLLGNEFFTAEDYWNLPEDQRAELINGKLYDRSCKGAPNFIIEIVSPSSRKMDYSTKNTLYSDAGVRECFWFLALPGIFSH